MRKKYVFPALLLAVLMLSGCGTVRTDPAANDVPAENSKKVAYVPLDDRPNNYECMEYMAQSLDYELLMPEQDAFSTRLNSAEGSKSGDRAAIYEWLLEQEENGCDRYIIFLDQLLSGGLVSSRAMTSSEPVSLSDGTVMSETELLQSLVDVLGRDTNNRVWLLDTVMRLAPTVGYGQWTLEDYKNVRAYCAEARPVLSGDALTVDNIVSGYKLSADGELIDPADYGTDTDMVSVSLAARERKLRLADELFADTDGSEVFRVLYGIDDSSEADSIQKNEIEYIRTLLRGGDALLSGVDDMGFKALARMYLDDIGWQGTAANVRYFGDTQDEAACDFDYRALEDIVAEHFEFFDIEQSGNAELQVFVLTKPGDESRKNRYCLELIKELDDCLNEGKPVILMDAGNNVYGNDFREMLCKKIELGKLIAYSGVLDMANLTGTAISHGIARYAYLVNGDISESSERGHMKTLADVIIKDICYRNIVRAETADKVTEMGGNPDNFNTPAIDQTAVLHFAVGRMEEETGNVIENLERSNFIASLEPYSERGWGGIELENYRFPWSRTFEMTMDVMAGRSTEPHENILGIYTK
ncbi:MAG: DUF4127 family protein [Oscillospiraceae bacterium]